MDIVTFVIIYSKK